MCIRDSIKCGSVVIPFDNQISKDTDLYRLYNTNIHEIIEQLTEHPFFVATQGHPEIGRAHV